VVSASSIASGIAIVPNTTRERDECLADPAQRLGTASPDPGREQRVVHAERRGRERHAELFRLDEPALREQRDERCPNTSVPSTRPASFGDCRHAFTSAMPVNRTR
jgi:hypothetical protein